MADTTNDIWNDNDGEEEAPRKGGRMRRFWIFFLILAAVLGVVVVAAYRDGTGFDALRRRFAYGGAEAAGEVRYQYNESENNRFAVLGNSLVVLSDTELRVLGEDGEEVWSTAVSMASPALAQSGDRAVAYDVGGSELYVLDQDGELLHLTANTGEPFIAANLNEDGYLAVTAQRQTSKGCVSVYDADLDLIFEFNASQRFVTDACVVGDSHLAAVTLGQEAGTFVSNLVIYRLDEEEPAADYDVTDGLVAAVTSWGNRLVTVSDTCLTFAGVDGEVEDTYSYQGDYLRGYDLNGDGFAALLLNRYRSGSVGRLVTVGEDGEEIASLDVNREVLSISAAGRYLAVLYTDSLVIYNSDLQEYAVLEGTDYASDVLMRTDGSALLLSMEYASLFLP